MLHVSSVRKRGRNVTSIHDNGRGGDSQTPSVAHAKCNSAIKGGCLLHERWIMGMKKGEAADCKEHMVRRRMKVRVSS